ncbi:hypothetical protein CBOM_01352 [Ceraceosorus bombacis]|uniref:Uncharacterized protein n=1 Tax=Ceraceosorus bombacis TaxID=401625 RepID=A0A0P1BCJ8_9BASI|nr:hypothetical protein CBOM_01352 [Ceraceosorus bombacis]
MCSTLGFRMATSFEGLAHCKQRRSSLHFAGGKWTELQGPASEAPLQLGERQTSLPGNFEPKHAALRELREGPRLRERTSRDNKWAAYVRSPTLSLAASLVKHRIVIWNMPI